jgi:arylsulfatase A-like enzyme
MSEKNYSRRKFLGVVSGSAAAVPFLKTRQQEKRPALEKIAGAKPRNVVFILSDDHRYDFMGFMGKPKFLKTPNMDKLARGGAHCQNAFVSTSLCSPSRASVLTGMYTHRHGVVDNDSPIPEHNVFFPRYLQQAGYETGFFGKWHMGHDDDAPRPGFDKWVSFRGQGVYYDPVLNVDGEQVKREGYVTDILTDYATDWLKQDRQKPFFLFLSHKAVHAMFEPAKRHLAKYDNVDLEYPASMADSEENYRNRPNWVKEQRNSWHGVDYMYHGEMDFDTFYRRYCETLLAVDESIGRVLDCLKAIGLDQSTLVFYMGDNGFSFGEHGLIDKRHMYEESMRVPLLAYCPDLIKPGTKVAQLIQNLDIAPTILEAAGVRPPKEMDGRSFLPLLKGEEIPWRDAVFYEYYWERPFPHTPTMHGIRTAHYKYIRYHGVWDSDELYDLEADPEEINNLIDEPEHKDLIQQFSNRIYDWLQQTDGMQIPLRRAGMWQANKRKPR